MKLLILIILSTACFVTNNDSKNTITELPKQMESASPSADELTDFTQDVKTPESGSVEDNMQNSLKNEPKSIEKVKLELDAPVENNETYVEIDQATESFIPVLEVDTFDLIEEKTSNIEEEKMEMDPQVKIVSNAILDHSLFDQLLTTFVSSTGKVNYKGIKSNLGDLDAYLELLNGNPVQNNWSREEKMVYWINAYNAFTLKLIVNNYPISSITKLHGGKPWDEKWIKIGSQNYSLNQIENDILRPQFKDARIHFAVNCAAKSCPPLLNKAWTAANLDKYFETQAKKFVNNKLFNELSSSKINISKIFDWYGDDFDDLIAFLNKYSDSKIDPNASISFKEYDWALNE